ncbi:helix-turn-helix domain-containing protein [Naumannella halotolerans]|jgi:transcriptional regulator with XRE-family HTH domain|uniref:Helix-turn-helix protein n=1 Tax=Naumannella halotolerans TaxID=993414 RepID=A0A4R7J899_9ACTN|nr:helix-turn-helix transcriptional regulator [Naumannella halotolerans]TDT33006.1 helix-turn-helix protein [Naumannella halotolerans]
MTIPAHRIAFGERLRTLRRELGWSSQEAFAHHVGLDRTYISGLERGSRNPTLDVIVKLAHGLDVKPAELLSTIY